MTNSVTSHSVLQSQFHYKMGQWLLEDGLSQFKQAFKSNIRSIQDLQTAAEIRKMSIAAARVFAAACGAANWITSPVPFISSGIHYLIEKVSHLFGSGTMGLVAHDVARIGEGIREQQEAFEGAKAARLEILPEVLAVTRSEVTAIQEASEANLKVIENIVASYDQSQPEIRQALEMLNSIEQYFMKCENPEGKIALIYLIEQEKQNTAELDAKLHALKQDKANLQERLNVLQTQAAAMKIVVPMQMQELGNVVDTYCRQAQFG